MMAQILRALVVEDDPSWQEIIGEILSECNLEVDITSNIEEAMQVLRSQPHCIAVVDLSLSPNNHNNIDGLRVLDAVRRFDSNCRTVLLTGFATVELAVTALTDYGASTFLRKENFQRGQFREIVNQILIGPPLQTTPIPASVSNASANEITEQTNQHRDKVSAQSDLSMLTEREREVLDLLAQGLTNREIAGMLTITINTVKRHLKAIFEKLGVHTRSAATAKVMEK